MTKWMKLNCTVYVSSENDHKDEEEVARDFNSGFGPAVEDFPGADVQKAEVESIETLTEDEARALDLLEDD